MKKINKNFQLKKVTISALTKARGGFRRIQSEFTDNPTDDPTAQTLCFDCPPPTIDN
ncbi:hypothetical protein ACJD0Z_09670 [Flavobacteriaceae bacterium M23B6Z8]